MLIHNLDNLRLLQVVLNLAFLQNDKTNGNGNRVRFIGNPINKSKPHVCLFLINLTIYLNFQRKGMSK